MAIVKITTTYDEILEINTNQTDINPAKLDNVELIYAVAKWAKEQNKHNRFFSIKAIEILYRF